MISLTSSGKKFLRGLLKRVKSAARADGREDGELAQLAVRMVTAPPTNAAGAATELKLEVDRPHEGDRIIEEQGERLLVVDPAAEKLLDGAILDAVETPDGGRLRVKRKNTDSRAA